MLATSDYAPFIVILTMRFVIVTFILSFLFYAPVNSSYGAYKTAVIENNTRSRPLHKKEGIIKVTHLKLSPDSRIKRSATSFIEGQYKINSATPAALCVLTSSYVFHNVLNDRLLLFPKHSFW